MYVLPEDGGWLLKDAGRIKKLYTVCATVGKKNNNNNKIKIKFKKKEREREEEEEEE